MTFKILTPMALGVYGGFQNASAVEMMRALNHGPLSDETAMGLKPFGETLQTHSPDAGSKFLEALNERDKDKLQNLLRGRSEAQLTRMALSLRRVGPGLSVSFDASSELLGEIQEAVGQPPYFISDSFEVELRRIINEQIRAGIIFKRVDPMDQQTIYETMEEAKKIAISFMSNDIERSARILFDLMHEPDLNDVTAVATYAFASDLFASQPDCLHLIEDRWPENDNRTEADRAWIQHARLLLFRLRGSNRKGMVEALIQQLALSHPEDATMLYKVLISNIY